MYTELQAVNELLSSIGIAPLASSSSQHPLYTPAVTKLTQVSNTVQSAGAWFNRSTVELKQNQLDGTVIVPSYVVYIRPTRHMDKDVVIRGSTLYDKSTRSNVLNRDIPAVIIEVLPLEYLPVTVQDYIIYRAKYEFYLSRGGQDPKLTEYRNQARLAQVEYNKERIRNAETRQPSYGRRQRQGRWT